MLFNSYIFILAFLPLTIIGYFLLNHFEAYRLGKLYLIGMSLWFYAYFNINYLPVIVASVLVNFTLYRLITDPKHSERQIIGSDGSGKIKQILLTLGIVLNIGVLFYFKYFDFFIENTNLLFKKHIPLLGLVLPLGISFFTFQQVGFLLDAARGEAVGYDFVDYALFVTFFPQLIAGPIVNHDEMIPQFQDVTIKNFDFDNASKGIYRFAMGLGKKVLLADVLGRGVALGYGSPESLSGLATILVMLSYMLQLYFDFSGYCDMASGAALMMNITLPDNFNSPHKAASISEFWKRWHLTLTRFLTRYVYIPLGGSRKGTARTYLNILLVYVISGMWHGSGWTFLLWGLATGSIMCVERLVRTSLTKNKAGIFGRVVGVIYCIIVTNFLLVIFRSESLGKMVTMYRQLFSGGYSIEATNMSFFKEYITPEFFYVFKILGLNADTQIPVVMCVGFILVGLIIALFCKNASEMTKNFKPTVIRMGFTVLIMIWSIVSFSQVSTFLYFDF